jgi:spore coat protein H
MYVMRTPRFERFGWLAALAAGCCALLASCGGGGSAAVDPALPELSAYNPAGERLPRSAARLTETSRGWEIYALDPAAAGFELRYDADRFHAVQIVRGQLYRESDLYLAVSSTPGVAAVGGYHLTAAPQTEPGGTLVARVVLQRGSADRGVSALPEGPAATARDFIFTDIGDGSVTFAWRYRNVGDYNQDSEVGIADITPIGQNFGKVSGDADWASASLADGDENGEVNVADLTQIGQNYGVQVVGYKLEQAATEAGLFTEVADVSYTVGEPEPWLVFRHNLVPAEGSWYRVRSYGADPAQGPATAPLQVSLLPPGQNPVPVIVPSATSGPIPLTVNFAATGSSDPDGTIVKYEWDLDGDAVYETDATATAGATTMQYTVSGSYTVRLRVTDNDGRSATANVQINAGPPPDAVPPTAGAYAMPHRGWIPLTVQLSPFGSADNEGITSWKWDLDNDGAYETDATADQGYASTVVTGSGTRQFKLQVGDAQGNTAVATVSVTALNPAQSSVDYQNVFRSDNVNRVDVALTQGNWDAMWVDPAAELEVPADAIIFGEVVPNIGLSMRGKGSLSSAGQKKAWQFDINDNDPNQEFHNMKELVFNNGHKDPSLLRERLTYSLLHSAGVPASNYASVELWFKVGAAAPEFWGVYLMLERVDKKFIENRFFDEDGNLYKCEAGADLTWKGPDIAAYPTVDGESVYAKRTNETAADWSDIINLIDVINNTPAEQFPAALEAVFDVDGFLRYQAVMLSVLNLDVYQYEAQNYYLYNNPASGKFEWIPWDLNESFGIYGDPALIQEHPLYSRVDIGESTVPAAPLFDKVMAVPEYREKYAAYVDLLRRTYFDYEVLRPQASALHDLLRPSVLKGDKMEYPLSAFDSNWDTDYAPLDGKFKFGLAELTQHRNAYVDANLLADL